MNTALLVINIILSILIVVFVLVQGGGAGLGSAWGGGGETFQTRRGIEKWILRGTGVMIALYLVLSVVNLIV